MSVTLRDIMTLPTFSGAKLVAGRGGINRIVVSISVSEYTSGTQFKDVELAPYEAGSELVLSAFYNSKDSVERQIENIREYHKSHVVGLVLFYVGLVLPSVDERLIEVAEEYNFPLIVMPENRPDLLYGQVIYEVMEMILKSDLTGESIRFDIIKQVLDFPKTQQNVGSAARLLSITAHATIILLDRSHQIVHASVWPNSIKVEQFIPFLEVPLLDDRINISNEIYKRYTGMIVVPGSDIRYYVIFKRGATLEESFIDQVGKTFETAIKLWETDGETSMSSDLVNAIFRDEPYLMGQLANTFNIDVYTLKNLIIVCPGDFNKLLSNRHHLEKMIHDEFSHVAKTLLYNIYSDCLVILIDGSVMRNELMGLCHELREELAERGVASSLIFCSGIREVSDIRRKFDFCRNELQFARKVYPERGVFTYSDMKYVAECRRVAESGEESVRGCSEIFNNIPQGERVSPEDLIDTLAVYYLDAQTNMQRASEILALHKNTVLYRVNKVKSYFPTQLEDITEKYELVRALAVNRLLRRKK